MILKKFASSQPVFFLTRGRPMESRYGSVEKHSAVSAAEHVAGVWDASARRRPGGTSARVLGKSPSASVISTDIAPAQAATVGKRKVADEKELNGWVNSL